MADTSKNKFPRRKQSQMAAEEDPEFTSSHNTLTKQLGMEELHS